MREMVGASELDPPLAVDAGIGPNWLDAKEWCSVGSLSPAHDGKLTRKQYEKELASASRSSWSSCRTGSSSRACGSW